MRGRALHEALFMFSEIFSTVAILTLCLVEMACNEWSVGKRTFTMHMESQKVTDSVIGVALLLVCQLIGAAVSHYMNGRKRGEEERQKTRRWRKECWAEHKVYFVSIVCGTMALCIFNGVKFLVDMNGENDI